MGNGHNTERIWDTINVMKSFFAGYRFISDTSELEFKTSNVTSMAIAFDVSCATTDLPTPVIGIQQSLLCARIYTPFD